MEKITTHTLDHYGIVAGICDTLKIVDRINKRLYKPDKRRIVCPGKAIKAMIINGLGFVNRCLYLTPTFFKDKPVDVLLCDTLKADDLNEYALGKTLDQIYEYGCTNLFGEVAFEIAKEHGLFGKTAKLDSTSFSLEGDYALNSSCEMNKNSQDTKRENEVQTPIKVVHGFSKAKRPDLKQIMLNMVVNGPADLPIWCEGKDGNASDKKSFAATIEKVNAFKAALNENNDFFWIADSALYRKESLLSMRDIKWITRVPETLASAKTAIEHAVNQDVWMDIGNGYCFQEVISNEGGIEQRWLIVNSQQAYAREIKTLETSITQEKIKADKEMWHLQNRLFSCEKDAIKHLTLIQKTYKYHTLTATAVPELKHDCKGRPKKDSIPSCIGYYLKNPHVILDEQKKKIASDKKGKFILSTNEMDATALSSVNILKNYKDQQSVERGFRFLKDPHFLADHFYLKNPKRIEALMMIMCLTLLVYNFGQYTVRKALTDNKETLPDQKKKEIQNPTLRWIFQMMTGVTIVSWNKQNTLQRQNSIANLDEIRTKIIRLCGGDVQKIYKT